MPSGPAGGDLSGTYPNPTVAKLNGVAAASYALLAGPTFTGAPVFPTGTTATTQAASNGTTKLATTAYVDTADALKALLAGPTFTGTPTFPTGTVATTQSATDSSIAVATTAYVASRSTIVGGQSIVARTSNSSTINTNNTLANDDTLLWAVGASERWFFEGYVTFTAADSSGAATTADVKFGWSVPTGGAMQWASLGFGTGNTGGPAGWQGTVTGSNPIAISTAATATSHGMAALVAGFSFAGYYTGDGSHAGNVNFQWSQDTSNAATLQINTNSILLLTRLA